MQITTTLAENLKWMAWNGAWHAANLLDGNTNDAGENKVKEREYFGKIGGSVGDIVQTPGISFLFQFRHRFEAHELLCTPLLPIL